MFERIKALIERARELKEVAHLTDHDLSDLGLTRDQVEAFVRMPKDVPDRVAAMAEIFGLNPQDLRAEFESWNDLLYTCGQCRERGACRHLLDHPETARPEDAGFCLNRDFFRSRAA